MTALDRYIDDLVNDVNTKDDFPKNESSWEELFELCKRLIAEIVMLRRSASQPSVYPTGLNAAQKEEVRQMIQSALDTGSA